jgi:hypothetical protein
MSRWAVVLLVVCTLLVGSTRTASAQGVAPCPAGVTLTVLAPDAAAPTTVNVTIAPALNIRAASAGDSTSFHLHYFVDTTPTPAGAAIPTDDSKVIHSGSTSQDLGALTPGMHTVAVVLGQFNHTACEARGSVTFIVGQSVGAPIAPKSGNAGLADSSSAALTVVLLVGVAVVVVVAARILASRRKP